MNPPSRTLTWDKTRRMAAKVMWAQDTWQEAFVLMGSTEGDFHVGWKVVHEKLYATQRNAGGQRLLYIQDIVPFDVYDLEVWHVPDDKDYWLLNGDLVYQDILGLPAGTGGANYIFAFILQAKIAAAKQASLYGFRFVQEP